MAQVGIHNVPPQARREPSAEAGAGAGAGPASGAGPGPAKELKLEVTPTAVEQIRKLDQKRRAEGNSAEGLRIGLRGGGCDGFSYLFEWSDRPAEARDRVFEFESEDGYKVRIFVDPKSLLYLQGTTLNFVTGMMGHGFKFENPNVKGSCGCGESVHF